MTIKYYIEADLLLNKIKKLKSVWDVEKYIEKEKAPLTTIIDKIVGNGEMRQNVDFIAFSKQYVINNPEKATKYFMDFLEGVKTNDR